MNRILILFSLLSIGNCVVYNVTCPLSEDISPCICYPETAQIYCVGKDIDDTHFKAIGPKLKTDHGLFHLLYIHNTKLKSIAKHEVFNVKFERIIIEENHDLVHIDPEAFKSGNLTSLQIRNNPALSLDIFNLAKNLTPSNSIYFDNNYIKEIPENGLASDSHKSTVESIFLSNNIYNEKIGKNAFAGHPHLGRLGLDYNDIHTIEDFGLNFTAATTLGHHLIIYLNNNKLSSKSFNNNTIVIPHNTYATFHLQNNSFTDFNEEVFKPLAVSGNKFALFGNKFHCDCKMKWIVDKPQSTNIFDVQCANHNNTDIYKLTESAFHCT